MQGAVYRSDLEAPPRWLLRPAGVLTQIACAFSLLIGTIGFVLVQVNQTAGTPYAIAFASVAMVGLILGGLMARGGMIAVVGSALVNGAIGGVLVGVDLSSVDVLLKMLPPSDIATAASILFGVGIGLCVLAVLCLASIPQARRYHRELRAAEDDAEKSGIWEMPLPFPVPSTMPAPGAPPPSAPPSGPSPFLLPATGGGGSASSGAIPMQRASSRGFPLPAPPPSHDGYRPSSLPAGFAEPQPSPIAPPEQRISSPSQPPPFADGPPLMPPLLASGPPPIAPYIPTNASTNPGWQPAPAHRTAMMVVRPPSEEKRSRRRVYIALGGLAIGLGAGVGVVVSSSPASRRAEVVTLDKGTPPPTATARPSGTPPPATPGLDAGSAAPVAAEPAAGDIAGVETLLAEQRARIEAADAKGLAATFAPNAYFIGLEGGDLAEGRAAIEEVLARNLGAPSSGRIEVTPRFSTRGREMNHVWTAQELELGGEGLPSRRITITQLVAFVNGAWTVVVAHWGRPVPDSTAERLAILGTLPVPKAIAAKATTPELGAAAAKLFASRQAFADGRSLRDDAFNFGSGPGERVAGGSRIQTLFGRLRSQLRAEGAMRVVDGREWDPAQAESPRVAYAALNVAYTSKSRAATDVTQTFRVLAILLNDGGNWTIVQTQFTNAGPVPGLE